MARKSKAGLHFNRRCYATYPSAPRTTDRGGGSSIMTSSTSFSRSPGNELFVEAMHLNTLHLNESQMERARSKKKYPHGRSQGFSNVGHMNSGVTGKRKTPRPTQRVYPHGRHLGFESGTGDLMQPQPQPQPQSDDRPQPQRQAHPQVKK